MKVVVNHLLCDGNGNCVDQAPDIFTIDDDDNMRLLQETIEPAALERVRRAVTMCPKAALSIADE